MHIRLSPGTSLTVIEGKSVLFSVRTGQSYGLNEIAAEMLRLGLEGGLDHAAERIALDYDAPAAEVRSDIDVLVQQLIELKFAQAVAGQGS
ncbi:MAG TPA: PqqD family protein [Xanthobacteraceae bacterium]|nr:PqqD family protein [Xanthobacteraceae bacterium]